MNENEVATAAKEKSTTSTSPWLNPLVLGLFAAAFGLLGNLLVAYLNNQNSQQVERLRLQSNLVVEAIKTNPDGACKNLVFFVKLGLVDDPRQAILKTCGAVPEGPPSLPTAQANIESLVGVVVDASNKPIQGAKVTMAGPNFPNAIEVTDSLGGFAFEGRIPWRSIVRLTVEKQGYETVDKNVHLSPKSTILIQMRREDR